MQDHQILAPTLLQSPDAPDLEVSVHRCPKQMRRDLLQVFPDFESAAGQSRVDMVQQRLGTVRSTEHKLAPLYIEDLLILPTCQHASLELVNWGPDAAEEKDLLLERFTAWANKMCDAIASAGFWADFCDPCSGLPMRSGGNVVFPEVYAMTKLRRYTTTNAGSCKILLHPVWGSAVYPASMFTNCPAPVLFRVLAQCGLYAETVDVSLADLKLEGKTE